MTKASVMKRLNIHTQIWSRALISAHLFNPFHATGLFLYPWKRWRNMFSDVFRRYSKRAVTWHGLFFRKLHFSFNSYPVLHNKRLRGYWFDSDSSYFEGSRWFLVHMDWDTVFSMYSLKQDPTFILKPYL